MKHYKTESYIKKNEGTDSPVIIGEVIRVNDLYYKCCLADPSSSDIEDELTCDDCDIKDLKEECVTPCIDCGPNEDQNCVYKLCNEPGYKNGKFIVREEKELISDYPFVAGVKLYGVVLPKTISNICKYCWGQEEGSERCMRLPQCSNRDENKSLLVLCSETELYKIICDLPEILNNKDEKKENLKEITKKILIENFMKPTISKKEFLEVIKLIKEQEKKDDEFCKFMEKYLDGRFIPMMNEHAMLAITKLMNIALKETNEEDSWWDWFLYECNMGEKEMSAFINKKEYVIKSPESFYDFVVTFLESVPEENIIEEQKPKLNMWSSLKYIFNKMELNDSITRDKIKKILSDEGFTINHNTLVRYLKYLKDNNVIYESYDKKGTYIKKYKYDLVGPLSDYKNSF